MQIVVNGEAFAAPEAGSIVEVLRLMALEGQRCAVELNGEIVPRGEWALCPLSAGDRLEVVRAIGGG